MAHTTHYDLIVAGAGIAGLSIAALAAADGLKVALAEQNYMTGGCAGSYIRKGYIFDTGATTLVGLDAGRPVDYLLQKLGCKVDALRLPVPMQVTLPSGKVLTRHQDLNVFIAEAEKIFGPEGQRKFWTKCRQLSEIVWRASTVFPFFPPEKFKDLVSAAASLRPWVLPALPYLFKTTHELIRQFIPNPSPEFLSFIDEQLIITSQNTAAETDALFGATALSYTFEGNYYLPGGIGKLAQTLETYLIHSGNTLMLRSRVNEVKAAGDVYEISIGTHTFTSKYFVSALPLPNTLTVFKEHLPLWKKKIIPQERLNSAYQLSIAAKSIYSGTCLHRQLHLTEPLPGLNSHSIFVSISHPDDHLRASEGKCVISVSTHLVGCQELNEDEKYAVTAEVIKVLDRHGILRPSDIDYIHASVTRDWKQWTGREHGFVGGYPRFAGIPVWNMPGHRLDGKRAYICGDSVYPGQGIPGAVTGALAAYAKMKADHF